MTIVVDDSDSSLGIALSRLKTDEVLGIPIIIELRDGVYSTSPFIFDSSIQASSVKLIGQSGTPVLQTAEPNARLFEISVGAPLVEMQGLVLRAPLLVSGGALHLEACRVQVRREESVRARRSLLQGLPAIDRGGAILLTAGSVDAKSSSFTRNAAQSGGAIYASGGNASFEGCLFEQNSASAVGGAIALTGDASVRLRNSSLVNNTILANDDTPEHSNSIHRAGTTLFHFGYELPTPLGRYVDSPGGRQSIVQPLLQVEELNGDYPYPCAAGRYGNGTSIKAQSGPWCSDICPPGFVCAANTSTPKPCPLGYYCARGSSIQLPCPAGTIGSSVELSSLHQCTKVPAGAWSPVGAHRVVNCSLSFFNPLPGANNESACLRCPDFSSTTEEGATSKADCKCAKGYFSSAHVLQALQCHICGVGTECTSPGVELTSLPLQPGYYRIANSSSDVRRCPGPSRGNSACHGGDRFANQCRSGLTGIYCEQCVNKTGHFYQAGTRTSAASCEACSSSGTLLAVELFLVIVVLAVCSRIACLRNSQMRAIEQQLRTSSRRLALQSKAKRIVSFYQIASSINHIYRVALPDSATHLVSFFHSAVTLGFNRIGMPLQCLGLHGYMPVLIFWMVAPFVFLLTIPLLFMARDLMHTHSAHTKGLLASAEPARSVSETLLRATPLCLKLLFLAYPTVSTVAFRVFDCEDFGALYGSYLRVDYSFHCDGDAYTAMKAVAVVAILIFPIGVPLTYFGLLLKASPAIRSQAPTRFSASLSFLHADYLPQFFWWEIVEVMRRFLLVGVACLIAPGSLSQLMMGTCVTLLFLILQLQARPHKRPEEGSLAMADGFFLLIIFFCCILIKMGSVTELQVVREQLPPTLVSQVSYPVVFLSFGLMTSVLGSLVLSLGFLTYNIRTEMRRYQDEAMALAKRRLRYKDTGEPVELPTHPDQYHLFLSQYVDRRILLCSLACQCVHSN